VSEFVDQCRAEWHRLGVPDAITNEMAADLAADLDEAAADGVSPEEVLGTAAFDPRGFAASWASERGVVPAVRAAASDRAPAPSRARVVVAALAIVAALALFVAALALVFSGHGGETVVARPDSILPGPGPADPGPHHAALLDAVRFIAALAIIAIGAGLAALAWWSWRRWRSPTLA
jgi:hypothetical protein